MPECINAHDEFPDIAVLKLTMNRIPILRKSQLGLEFEESF